MEQNTSGTENKTCQFKSEYDADYNCPEPEQLYISITTRVKR